MRPAVDYQIDRIRALAAPNGDQRMNMESRQGPMAQSMNAPGPDPMLTHLSNWWDGFVGKGQGSGWFGMNTVPQELNRLHDVKERYGDMSPEALAAFIDSPLLPGPGVMAGTVGKVAGALDGITAYHGSPHTFDRFDMSKIGTGEGAQAYGHGLYFAENEATAKAYREALSGDNIDARNFFRGTEMVPDVGELFDKAEAAARAAGARGDQSRSIARDIIDSLEEMDGKPASQFLDVYDVDPQFADAYRAAAEAVGDVSYRLNPGSMYQVRINANPDDFLDWDKPLSEQSEAVRAYMEASGVRAGQSEQEIFDEMVKYGLSEDDARAYARANAYEATGEHAYRELTSKGMESDGRRYVGLVAENNAEIQTMEALRRAGVPGIKYLDAGSRNAGDGSRNYVVFDDKLVEILRRYGLLAPAGAGLGLAATGNNAEAGQ